MNYSIDKEYQLEVFPGKGGWIYALIPEIAQDKSIYQKDNWQTSWGLGAPAVEARSFPNSNPIRDSGLFRA